MPLRLVEIYLPAAAQEGLWVLLEDGQREEAWHEELSEERVRVKLLLDANATEQLLDRLEARFGATKGFRVLLLPVEATIPRLAQPAKEPEEEEKEEASPGKPKEKKKPSRISREELYQALGASSRLDRTFLMMVVLSTIVAAIGLVRDNTAAVIAAMVIAPLLGPNIALSLAITLGDGELARRVARVNLAGVGLALGLGLLIGAAWPPVADPTELLARTQVGPSDLILALAAGSAGVLAFTSGAPATLIGVMVAVALLPPTVTVGIMASQLRGPETLGAAMLLVTNVVCLQLAAVLTFWWQGVTPRRYWETDIARRATHRAVGVLVVLVMTLLALMLLGVLRRAG